MRVEEDAGAEAGIDSENSGRPWPLEEGPAVWWMDGTELAPERIDSRLWEGWSEAEVFGVGFCEADGGCIAAVCFGIMY